MEPMKNLKVIDQMANLSAKSFNESDLVKHVHKLLEMMTRRPYEVKDGSIRPFLCDVADYCIRNGIAPENLPAALLTALALNSASLGHPLAIILKTNDPMIVDHLLKVCKDMTPKGRYIEFHQKLSAEELFQKPDSFRSKTIICRSPKGSKGAIHDILNLISTGRSCRQAQYKSKLGDLYEEKSIEVPVAFIGVEIGDESFDINDPSVVRVTLSKNEDNKALTLPGYGKSQSNYKKNSSYISTTNRYFERLSCRQVEIPYDDQIISQFINQEVEKIKLKYKSVHSLLSLLSISNNPPQFLAEEVFGYYLCKKPANFYPVVTSGQAITATKVEYYLMKLLCEGVIPLENEHYTPDQILLFEVVEKINFRKLFAASTIDPRDKVKVLITLHKSNNYWAKFQDIFKEVNSRGGKVVPVPVIDKDLNKLEKLELITKSKFPKTSDFGYYINYTSIGKHVTFLNPSEIDDPEFKMAPVQVVNPLTKNVEII